MGELGDRKRHLSVGSAEGECKFVEVACTYLCGQRIQRRELPEHKAIGCPQRPFKCLLCGHDATHSEIINEHYSRCKKFPLECPNKCGEKAIERHNIPSHREKCPLEVITCEFSHAGCTVNELPRAKMEDHKRRNIEEHHSMTIATIQQQKILIANLQQQAETTANWVKQLVAHLKPESLAIAESPSIVFIPPPAFIMTNFSRHKSASDPWCSPPFYSHIGGYKMCLKVYSNDSSAGTHMSVFVTLLRGEHDDDLLWPFRGSITLQLCNCREDTGHLDDTLNFDGSLGDDVAERVTEGERAAVGSGRPHFTPHTALCYNASKNTEFLVNDTLKFRVTAIKLTNLVM